MKIKNIVSLKPVLVEPEDEGFDLKALVMFVDFANMKVYGQDGTECSPEFSEQVIKKEMRRVFGGLAEK